MSKEDRKYIFCGEKILFPFTCNYCGQSYSGDNTLQDIHDCFSHPKIILEL